MSPVRNNATSERRTRHRTGGLRTAPPGPTGNDGETAASETVNTTETLAKYQLRPTKSLGQNFLTDIHIIEKIVDAASVTKEDLVLEVGPGIGSMTLSLAKRAGKVLAVEIDRHLIPPLKDLLGDFPHVTVVHADILKTDLHALVAAWPGPLKVVSNLPYYITTPIMMHLLESDIPWHTLVFMVQKEVAQRMAAQPGNKDYSALTLGIRCLSDPKLCFHVSRHCFYPKPDVDSAVVRLVTEKKAILANTDMALFRQVVRASFSQRRKTMQNALGSAPWLNGGKETVRVILNTVGVPENARAETLSLEQFAEITNALSALGNETPESSMAQMAGVKRTCSFTIYTDIDNKEDNMISQRLPMARYLDHAVLKPEMSRSEAKAAIQLGIDYHVRTVCVRPCDIALAAEMCQGTETEVSSTLAFPHGCITPAEKAFAAKQAIADGTKEIDMVVNYGFVRSGYTEKVLEDIHAVVDVAKPAGILVKVILETTALTLEEIAYATDLAIKAGADFVKTSTGFHTGGASVEAVKTMIDTGKGRIQVKASGGIRTLEDAERFLDLGCTRLGVGYTTTPVLCGGGKASGDAGTY